MILKETILSAFSERLTLLKWLKKVEAALKANVLTDVSVEQVSDSQVKLKFTFENGDYVESPILTLPRGEKGERGRDGLDGQGIAATIEVGTVTTGAAGTNASVTNVGTEQRAILNFVIPRGDKGATGEQGAEGSAGVGFDNADFISINDGALNITAGDNGVNIEATFEVAVGEEILEIPSAMYLPLKGSESIVIDVDESGEFIDIHLDADIAAKLSRALVTPMSAPASISLVAVDTSNAQTMLPIGDGLSIEGGVLKVTGGSGGSGGSGGTGCTVTINTDKMNISNGNHISYFTVGSHVPNDITTIGSFNIPNVSCVSFSTLGDGELQFTVKNGSCIVILDDGTIKCSLNNDVTVTPAVNQAVYIIPITDVYLYAYRPPTIPGG